MIPQLLPTDLWSRPCRIVNVVDGDTVDVDVDLGYGMVLQSARHRPIRVRLLGVDCPEKKDGYGPWSAARQFTVGWDYTRDPDTDNEEQFRWEKRWYLTIRTVKDPKDSFGRYLATIWAVSDGSCLNEELVKAGHAVEWTP
jgi:micrococcal nuclease